MEIHANGVMWLKSHFGIDAPGNSLVSDAGAHFYIGGEGNLFLPGQDRTKRQVSGAKEPDDRN